jgi:hypothetical protein
MTYQPNIPNAGDRPSDSQLDIYNNFTALNTIFAENHYEYVFATVGNRGKHKFCSFVSQAPGPATDTHEGAVYCKDVGGRPTLFFRRENSGTEIQIGCLHSPNNSSDGSTFLPGNILIQWGSDNYPSGESGAISYDNAFSAPPYSIVVTARRSDDLSNHDPMYVSTDHPPTASTFRIVNTATSGHTGFWIAIGPA